MSRYLLFMISFVVIFLFGCGQSVDQGSLLDKPPPDMESLESEPVEQSEPEPDGPAPTETTSLSESLSELTVHFIDAGQADATLFQYTDNGEDYTILFDAGDWNKRDVVNYLLEQNVSFIDLIIISHPHADHIGQLAPIMTDFEVGEVWMSGNTTNSGTFQIALETVLTSNADYYEPRAGESFDIGSLQIEVLHPEKLTGKLNEDSISARITYGDISFLFTGDALRNEELEILNRSKDIEAHILQLGHHGSNTSSHPEFIKAVNPEVAIYSAGADNQYGHPHEEVVSLIQSMGISLYGTDMNGDIIVTTDGLEYSISTNKNGKASPDKQENTVKKQESSSPKEANANTSCVDINQATLEELQQIIHIGPSRAEEVISKRPFNSVDGLISINGIGNARLADIKTQGLACVGG